MSQRSAPFVLPDDVETKGDGRKLLSVLQADILAFRSEAFPPVGLNQAAADLPVFWGNEDQVRSYQQTWSDLVDRAMAFYPSAYLPPDFLPLPASLEIPQFFYRVERLHLTRTRAKESKNFGAVGALLDKCGAFSGDQVLAMEQALATYGEAARLVAHREFVDLRAYVFCRDLQGRLLEPVRVRFYRTGLVVHGLEGFYVVDSRQKPRKRRNDAYVNPIADNGVWRVFVKF